MLNHSSLSHDLLQHLLANKKNPKHLNKSKQSRFIGGVLNFLVPQNHPFDSDFPLNILKHPAIGDISASKHLHILTPQHEQMDVVFIIFHGCVP